MMSRIATVALLTLLSLLNFCDAQTREEKVRSDRKRVVAEGFWIYNDLPKAFEEAKKTGKPIVVVLRCLPCEECVKLDDDLVDQDPIVRPLLKKFVCARQVSTNGLDLSLFQYDTDQSFAVFFLNADGTIYGRFGTRSHRTEWVQDVSISGLAEALRGALELHGDYPNNKSSLAGKRGSPPLFPSPEKFPSLKGKFTDSLNYKGNVTKSCIHCHQIGDAVREYYHSNGKKIPKDVFYPYPHPKTVGWTLDPNTSATLREVAKGSSADKAGFRTGDTITSLNGQPILSSADIQWVLHHLAPEGGTVLASVRRSEKPHKLQLTVEDGWREQGDLSWRVSTWGLVGKASGGLRLEPLSEEDRAKQEIENGKMALRVTYVGKYGTHSAAKKAGFRKNDVIISVDGKTDLVTEGAFLEYGVNERKIGDRISATVLRNKKRITMKIPIQK